MPAQFEHPGAECVRQRKQLRRFTPALSHST